MEHADYMRRAIAAAREGIAQGQTPFGACIVRDGTVLGCRHNGVWATQDITAHAEILAIRDTCRALETVDLSGAAIYSTCEPCPMCFSACHWAKLDRIYYGAGIAEARAAGFNEIAISNHELKFQGGSPIEVHSDLLKEECAELFRIWLEKKLSPPY